MGETGPHSKMVALALPGLLGELALARVPAARLQSDQATLVGVAPHKLQLSNGRPGARRQGRGLVDVLIHWF